MSNQQRGVEVSIKGFDAKVRITGNRETTSASIEVTLDGEPFSESSGVWSGFCDTDIAYTMVNASIGLRKQIEPSEIWGIIMDKLGDCTCD